MSRRVTVSTETLRVEVHTPPNSLWLRAYSPLGRAHAEQALREFIVAPRGGDPDSATFRWGYDDVVHIFWDPA